MTLPVKILFYLENEEIALIEIKRTDRPEELDKSKVYFWLLFKKSSGEIEKLDFVSMKYGQEKEERVFSQGRLTFDKHFGSFEDFAGQHPLRNIPATQLSGEFEEKINHYFQGQKG